jgi:hypothetical protein
VLNDNDGGTDLLRNDAGGPSGGEVAARIYSVSVDKRKTCKHYLLLITNDSDLSGSEEDL